MSLCQTGCTEEAVIALGTRLPRYLCASCAELSRFRRYRVARVIASGVDLRRDLVGWWIDGEPVRPAPLSEVVASATLPPCPDHDRHPLLRPSPLGGGLLCYVCPVGGCLVSGVSAATEELAAEGWRDVLE